MKTVLLSTLCFLPMLGSAMPTTPIKFIKGSYCGSFTGDMSKGRKFTINLGANQEFTIDTGNSYVASVVDSKGIILSDQSDSSYSYQYITKNKGKHTIRMSGEVNSYVEFCAY